MSTADRCQWSATGSVSWVTVSSGGPRTGSGSVAYAVAQNSEEASRTGTITVGAKAFTVTQAGEAAECDVNISPSTASYAAAAAAGTFTVTTPQQCAWSATSNAPWLTFTSASSGTGPSSLAYAVARNTDASPRTGTIVVGSRTFTVIQAGDTPPCGYSVSPVAFNACMASMTLTATVTTQQGCTWTAEPDAPWITVIGGQTGSGSGVVTFRLTDNYDLPRESVVKVRWPTPTAGQNLQVAQAGCRYAVSTSTISIAAAGGTGRFDVLQVSDPNTCGGPLQDACLWTAESDVPWITITTSMPRRGDDPVSFTVAANPGTAPRTGRITVRDKTVVITQAGQ